MAKWELIEDHYLNVESYRGRPIEWEYTEQDLTTGMMNRQRYPVPMYLPRGSIIGTPGSGAESIYTGKPTMAMEPLDEEAEALTEAERPRWQHPIDTLPVNGGMNLAEQEFMKNMMAQFAAQVGQAIAVPKPDSVSADEFKALQEQVAALAKRNAELESKAGDRR